MLTLKRTGSWFRFFCFGLVFLLVSSCPAEARVKKTKPKKRTGYVTAQAVYAMDHTNRRVLFSRQAHKRFYPASTVKLLTALVVLDQLSLDEEVVVSCRAAGVQPTVAGLTRGARYTASDLLEVLLATSANDAGVALAEAVSGNESAFAALMNKKARSLGARGSHFTNATGLPDKNQYTTAYDLALITRAAFRHSFISRVMKKKTVSITGSDGKKIIRNNHNKLLWRVAYPNVLGKTGYTIAAGHCYAGVAYYKDRTVSVVILKSRQPWQDIANILNLKFKTTGKKR